MSYSLLTLEVENHTSHRIGVIREDLHKPFWIIRGGAPGKSSFQHLSGSKLLEVGGTLPSEQNWARGSVALFGGVLDGAMQMMFSVSVVPAHRLTRCLDRRLPSRVVAFRG
jgi:hypothetical protein